MRQRASCNHVCLQLETRATEQESSFPRLEDVLAVLHERDEVVEVAVGAGTQFRELGLVNLLDLQ